MSEKYVQFPSGDIQIEGMFSPNDPGRGTVFAHPHSLYGGSMDDYVVSIALSVLDEAGWSTLRFNFRGVGGSGGAFDQGRGEAEDLIAAAEFLKEQGASRLLVGGYSFGAYVAARAWPRLKALAADPLVLIAPPASMMDFDFLTAETEIGLIVCGAEDNIAPPAAAEALNARLDKPASLTVIPRTDHFFGGAAKPLAQALADYVR